MRISLVSDDTSRAQGNDEVEMLEKLEYKAKEML